jgi:hypothetical protein
MQIALTKFIFPCYSQEMQTPKANIQTFSRRINFCNGEVAILVFNRFIFSNDLCQTSGIHEMLAEVLWKSSLLENKGDAYLEVHHRFLRRVLDQTR